MNKREWLRTQGFDVGERGRFSVEMIEALSEYDGGSTNSAPVASVETIIHKSVSTVMRDASAYVAKTREGLTVACGICYLCHDTVMYCACSDGPAPPTYLTDDIVEWYPVYSR